MVAELPAPPVPAEVDLRSYSFLPIDVARIRDSKIVDTVTGDEFRAAFLLWCAAWHQVPAGSLPDDESQLAKFAGYGRVVKEWLKVRQGALYGFVKCSDGRLYHPVICEKVLDAWEKRSSAVSRGKKGAAIRHGLASSSAKENSSSAKKNLSGKVSNREQSKPNQSENRTEGEVAPLTPKGDGGGVPSLAMGEVDQAIDDYNAVAFNLPKWTECKQRTSNRRKVIGARLAEYGLQGWRKALEMAAESSFLSGEPPRTGNHQNWRVDILWFAKAENFAKISEGKYPAGGGSPVGVESALMGIFEGAQLGEHR